MMKINIYILSVFIVFSCGTSLKTASKEPQFSRVNVYKIDQFKTSIISHTCDDIKSNFEEDYIFLDIDDLLEYERFINGIKRVNDSLSILDVNPSLTIEFHNKENKLLHQFCWSMACFSLDGKVYGNSKKVNDFLRNKGLIIEVVE